MELREIEKRKIDCGRKFLAEITSDQVQYDVVDSHLDPAAYPHREGASRTSG